MLTFYLCGNLFGLDILAVKEINSKVQYTPVFDAPPQVTGLLNMRGQVVTLINLARLMGYDWEDTTGNATCIILKTTPDNPDYIGICIDCPGTVVEIDQTSCEPPPANLSSMEIKYIKTAVQLERELLLLLEVSAFC